jgi:Dyp-type peroxidase family
MALTLNETRVNNSNKYSVMLDDLQANILKHHGRNYAYHFFLTINIKYISESKKWISDFAKNKISNTSKQLIDSTEYNKSKKDGGTIYTLSISNFGYEKLGIENSITPSESSFKMGMKPRAEELNDNIQEWESEFQNEIDILIILADSDESNSINNKIALEKELSAIFNIVKIQKGEVLKNEQGIGIEHFGYADGISQPIFFENEIITQEQNNLWQDESRLKLALVKDKGGKFDDSYGSYLVFRKLEQNVEAFKDAEASLPKILDEKGVINDELAGAMIIGRFENGTEVINHSNEINITNPKDLNNDFDYKIENTKSKCPFHSHIRLTNPRADLGSTDIDSFVKNVRLVRRGIPYDDIPNGRGLLSNKPCGNVGLLFMCYQSNIKNQFEFIQSTWVNKGIVPSSEHPNDEKVGQDGIIGQGIKFIKDKFLPRKWGEENNENKISFSNSLSKFVTMRGGEYFFTPSISFLKSLHSVSPHS